MYYILINCILSARKEKKMKNEKINNFSRRLEIVFIISCYLINKINLKKSISENIGNIIKNLELYNNTIIQRPF